ncbi:MAG: hypothetical protein JO034_30145, partial [Singulisphaera sp.]|nr:hypothetical protein [Singulisphaera sp.]
MVRFGTRAGLAPARCWVLFLMVMGGVAIAPAGAQRAPSVAQQPPAIIYQAPPDGTWTADAVLDDRRVVTDG